MPSTEWYKSWFNSPYYHKLYFERDEGEAKAFISKLIDHLKPAANSRMLDIACGKGRHSRILAAYGFNVSGFDISIDSINEAKQFESEHLQFYLHDMRLPFWVNYFDFAFNFFTSFGYFPTQREHDDAIRTIAASIKRGGVLLIDYLNVHFSEEHLNKNELKTIGETQYNIERWHDESFFYKKISVTDPELNQPIEFTEKVKKFSLEDFTKMLAAQKMQITEVFGDYSLNGYHADKTPRMIIAAKKSR